MSYKISKLSYGTSKPSLILKIDCDLEISDICYADSVGFILSLPKHHCIGKVSNGKVEIPWIGQMNQSGAKDGYLVKLDYPSSVYYLKSHNLCFVIESGGSKIRKIQLWNRHAIALLGKNSHDKTKSFFANIKNVGNLKTDCGIDSRGNIYWVVDGLNRCFKYDVGLGDVVNYVGDGRSGFTVSNSLRNCRLSGPRGVFVDNKSIYISDTKNRCIRKVENDVTSIAVGDPLKNTILPSKIRGCRNVLYFINGQEIRYAANNNTGILYGSEGIISIDVDDDKNIYILEKV